MLQKKFKEKSRVVVLLAVMTASGATTQCKENGHLLLGKLARL